jgi:aminomethyltransferase
MAIISILRNSGLSRVFGFSNRSGKALVMRGFSTSPLLQTLIHDLHVKDGGQMVDFAGYSMPVQYKGDGKHALSIIDSTKWTRESASLFDVSHMCSVRWTGKNAYDFVERVTTADVHGMKVNTGGLSVIPNASGGVIDDTMVSKVVSKEHGEHVYQVINAGCAPKDLKHFKEEMAKFDGEVNMEVMWDSRGLYAIQGPKAVKVVERLCGQDLTKVAFGDSLFVNIDGAECLISRCGYTGEDGFEIYVPGEAAERVWLKLRDEPEVRLAALGARDALRLEAGLCLYGHDLDEDISPIEAGLTWVIPKVRRSGDRANFVGADKILPQITDKSLVTKLRAGLRPESGLFAREGSIIETPDGTEVGKVTSGTMSPCMRKNVAIGFINKPFNKQGTELNVVVRNKRYPAKVVKMPFVPTKYYKPE